MWSGWKKSGRRSGSGRSANGRKRRRRRTYLSVAKPVFHGKRLVLSCNTLVGYRAFKSKVREGALPASYRFISQSDFHLMRGKFCVRKKERRTHEGV